MIFENLFLITAFVCLIGLLATVIGANAYELKEVAEKKQQLRAPHARRFRARPFVSILLLTYNDENNVARCLESILRSSYRKLAVRVIDNGSTDRTKAVVKQYMETHPYKDIKLIARRSHVRFLPDILKGYQRYVSGEFILVCDCRKGLEKQAIARAVSHFNANPATAILYAKQRVVTRYSTVGFFQRYEALLRQNIQKFSSISNSEYRLTLEGAICRPWAFSALLAAPKKAASKKRLDTLGNKKIRTYFASDVIMDSDALPSFGKLLQQRYRLQRQRLQSIIAHRRIVFSRSTDYTTFLTYFRLPFAACVAAVTLCAPPLLCYFIYLAVHLEEPTLLFVSCAALAALLVLAIWGEQQLRFRQKVLYTLFVPITYSIFFVLTFVQFFAVLGTVFSRRSGRSRASTTYEVRA
jgi:cellulose synthase/poly-beta-1,6-N-acetylglucosamine synthase-like glycosyltransferase